MITFLKNWHNIWYFPFRRKSFDIPSVYFAQILTFRPQAFLKKWIYANVTFCLLSLTGKVLVLSDRLNNVESGTDNSWQPSFSNLGLTRSSPIALFVLSPGQTYVATALRPLRDWQFTPIAEVATRSPIGPGVVAEKSTTDRGPRCDQISRSQVFVLALATDLVADRSRQSRRPVPDQSPTDRRLILLESGRGYRWN